MTIDNVQLFVFIGMHVIFIATMYFLIKDINQFSARQLIERWERESRERALEQSEDSKQYCEKLNQYAKNHPSKMAS